MLQRSCRPVSFALALALVAGSPAAQAAEIVYGISSSTDSLYVLNKATGQATLVGSLGGDVSFGGATILNNTLFASDVSVSGSPRFGTVNVATGAFSALSTQGGSLNWWGIAADANTGRIYSVRSDNAGSSNVFPLVYTNAAGTSITTVGNVTGQPANTSFADLAYDSSRGILYGVGQADNKLYTINTTTAAATAVGSLGLTQSVGGLAGLTYDAGADQLLLTNRTTSGASAPCSLYAVSATTGHATLIGDTGVNTIDAIAWAATPIPEPAGLLAGGLVAAGLAATRRRVR